MPIAKTQNYKVGDWVVYTKPKFSSRPGPRAKDISPAASGDTYSYIVDKLWVVESVADDVVRIRTRGGKSHEIQVDDPNLHRASWWERLIYRSKFPQLTQDAEQST